MTAKGRLVLPKQPAPLKKLSFCSANTVNPLATAHARHCAHTDKGEPTTGTALRKLDPIVSYTSLKQPTYPPLS